MELYLAIATLREDKPDSYYQARAADEVFQVVGSNPAKLGELGITQEEYKYFMIAGLIAQSLSILNDVRHSEPLVHPVLADPRKVVQLLEAFGMDAQTLARITPDIYQLTAVQYRSLPASGKLNKAEAGLVVREALGSHSESLRKRMADIVSCLDTHGDTEIGNVLGRYMTEWGMSTRASATATLYRMTTMVNDDDALPFKIVITGAKRCGDKRTLCFMVRQHS